MADKAALRATMRVRRKAYVVGRGQAIARDWLALVEQALPNLSGFTRVASYCPIGSEISPRPLEQALFSLNIKLALPCIADIWAAALEFASFSPGDPLIVEARSGIPEPYALAERLIPNVVLVPLLAADTRGIRLGQGAGHYDRTLRLLRSAHRVLAVGLAYDCQIIDHVPDDPWDEPLDALVTPSGWINFS